VERLSVVSGSSSQVHAGLVRQDIPPFPNPIRYRRISPLARGALAAAARVQFPRLALIASPFFRPLHEPRSFVSLGSPELPPTLHL
jgi:hypothetical protein